MANVSSGEVASYLHSMISSLV